MVVVLMLLVLIVEANSLLVMVAFTMLALSAVNIEVKTDDDETVVVLIENPLMTSDATRLLVLIAFVTVRLFAARVDAVRVEKVLVPVMEYGAPLIVLTVMEEKLEVLGAFMMGLRTWREVVRGVTITAPFAASRVITGATPSAVE